MKDELLIPHEATSKDQHKNNSTSPISYNMTEMMNSLNQLSPKKLANLTLSPNRTYGGNSSLQPSPTSPKIEKRTRSNSNTVIMLNGSHGDISSSRLSSHITQRSNSTIDYNPKTETHSNDTSQYRRGNMRSYSTGHYRTQNKKSWRLSIFNRVAAPTKYPSSSDSNYQVTSSIDLIRRKLSQKEIRALWRKAILETLLLIRMEKENIHLQARQGAAEMKRLKLHYKEITPCMKDVSQEWDEILASSDIPHVDIASIVKKGVPQNKRGEVWEYLIKDYCAKVKVNTETDELPPHYHTPYEDLLKQLTTYQHAILIDLGRTFPSHPYFSTELGVGQLSMFNLLKAYSLVDHEVGYCQGLSFIAGIFLMHMREEQAFEALKFIMYKLNVRQQYRPEMAQLQTQMYMLSRLLHDHHIDLYEHFESNEIVPSLYATAWFLTLFASEFPLGFVSRVFDLLLLNGQEIIFKVALVLLGNHKELIKDANGLESIVKFLKETLPEMGMIQMERVFNQVFELDISKQLSTYEIEYQVLQDEMISPSNLDITDSYNISELEKANQNIQQQNFLLTEQLAAANTTSHELAGHCSRYTSEVAKFNEKVDELNAHIYSLEIERALMLHTINDIKRLHPEIGVPPFLASQTLDDSLIHNPSLIELIDQNQLFFDNSKPDYNRILKSNGSTQTNSMSKCDHVT